MAPCASPTLAVKQRAGKQSKKILIKRKKNRLQLNSNEKMTFYIGRSAPVGPLFGRPTARFIVTHATTSERGVGQRKRAIRESVLVRRERASRQASCFPLGTRSNRARERGKRARLVSLEGSTAPPPPPRRPPAASLPFQCPRTSLCTRYCAVHVGLLLMSFSFFFPFHPVLAPFAFCIILLLLYRSLSGDFSC